jgi:hypothetical protein
MGLETRRNGNVYYYEKRRVGDKVVSEYLGSGIIADLAQRRAEIERTRREAEREKLKRHRMSMAEIDKSLDDFSRLCDALMTAELLLNGYHQHKGQWRRRRK